MKVIGSLLLFGVFIVGYASLNPPSVLENNQQRLVNDAKKSNEKAYFNVGEQLSVSMPKSLKGIDHGVILRVNDNGDLIVDRHLRDLFEFYLSAMGEESLNVILKRIQGEFYKHLPNSAIVQAKALLRDYVDYRIDLASVNENIDMLDTNGLNQVELLRLQKNEVAQLRSQYFNQESYRAFFEKEDVLDQYMLSQMSIMEDQNLTPEEKQQQMALLTQTLPEQEQQLRKKVSQHSDISAEVKEMRSQGDSDEAIYQHRAKLLGENAAQNLADLDRKRSEWKGRLDDYVLKRNDILASGLSESDAKQAVSVLIESNFSEREGLRVKALNSSL
jgi:lipase chaperone LimK